jgi:hydrogenase/urease accessory protein HupE
MAALGRLIAASLALVLLAAPAEAHGNFNGGDFYAGLLQPVYHPESLLAALALVLWSTQQAPRAGFLACAAFAGAIALGGAAALLGVRLPAAEWGTRAAMLVFGPLAAARLRLPLPMAAALAVLAGLASGAAATAPEVAQIQRPVLWTLGLGGGVALLGVYAHQMVWRFQAFWMQVAVRVVGSWITAIGLLVSVLAATRVRP